MTIDQLNINKGFPCNPKNYTPCATRDIKFIVIHYTGGVGTALANAKYYQGPSREASAHYFVGHASETGQIYQSVADHDKAWHCGTTGAYYSDCRNTNSIGIEVACHNDTADKTAASSGWYFDAVTIDRLVDLVRALMDKYKVDVDHVIRHYDVTHKICPAMWVHDAEAWKSFKNRLTGSTTENKAPSTPQNKPTLKTGSKGDNVVTLQTKLKALGFYAGALDGDFGPKTAAAVKAFQTSKKLTPDGIVGPVTWAALL